METLFVTAADLIMEMGEVEPVDKDLLVSSCIVKAIQSFSRINIVVLASRNKTLTEAKQEDIGREISKVLFYSACLVFLRDLDAGAFEEDSIVTLSESIEPVYQQDAILCSINGITNLSDLAAEIYADPIHYAVMGAMEEDAPTVVPVGNITATREGEEDDDIDTGPTSEEEFCIASVLACCYLLADRFELDLGNLEHNAGLLVKI